MPSSEEERLFVIREAYRKARQREARDLAQAKSAAQVRAILRNVRNLRNKHDKATITALEASGADVEAAYRAAKQAQEDVDDAYANARDIADKIRLVGKVTTKVGDLLTKASKKK